jgi:hypothetical protein
VPRPIAATALHALGLTALVVISLSLRGGDTSTASWGLVAIPVLLLAAASLVVRLAVARDRTRPTRGRAADEAADVAAVRTRSEPAAAIRVSVEAAPRHAAGRPGGSD